MSFVYFSGPHKRLIIILLLTAIHSFFVGIGLIVQIPKLMLLFGFGHINQPFFSAQAGIFHILLAVAYALAALNPQHNNTLIKFIITVKITATLFLFMYFFFIESIWMVLVSGIVDGLFALGILIAHRSFFKALNQNG